MLPVHLVFKFLRMGGKVCIHFRTPRLGCISVVEHVKVGFDPKYHKKVNKIKLKVVKKSLPSKWRRSLRLSTKFGSYFVISSPVLMYSLLSTAQGQGHWFPWYLFLNKSRSLRLSRSSNILFELFVSGAFCVSLLLCGVGHCAEIRVSRPVCQVSLRDILLSISLWECLVLSFILGMGILHNGLMLHIGLTVLVISLPWPLKSWNYRHEPPCLVLVPVLYLSLV